MAGESFHCQETLMLNVYSTYNQLKVMLPRLGITTKFIQGDKPEDFANAIDDNTKAIYIEVCALIKVYRTTNT